MYHQNFTDCGSKLPPSPEPASDLYCHDFRAVICTVRINNRVYYTLTGRNCGNPTPEAAVTTACPEQNPPWPPLLFNSPSTVTVSQQESSVVDVTSRHCTQLPHLQPMRHFIGPNDRQLLCCRLLAPFENWPCFQQKMFICPAIAS
jgi:hypothetical protein